MKNSRKKDYETKRFRIIRYIVGGLFTFGYFFYLTYLSYNIIIDSPLLKVERSFLDKIDVPDMGICASTNFQILRCDLMIKNHDETSAHKVQIDRCSDYMIPEIPDPVNLGRNRNFCYTFRANKTIEFSHPNLDGLQKIGFYFYQNTTAAEKENLGIASLSIQLTSPDFNPLRHPEQVVSQMDNATLSELKLQWNFITGMAGYVALVKFRTSVYKAILPGDLNAIIGFKPRYHNTPKIESLINYLPLNEDPFDIPIGTTGYFSVAAGSFIQEQKVEERSNTILSSVAAAGGALGVLGSIFVLIFGESRLNPWGIAHRILKQKQYTNTLIFDKVDDDLFLSQPQLSNLLDKRLNQRSTISQDDRTKLIEHEISEIKFVINNYLLDTSNWKKEENNNNSIGDNDKVGIQNNFNWEKTYKLILGKLNDLVH